MAHHSLSVVIPAYNEEQYIGACLKALIAQLSDIDEIIVVDNNSNDATADIVREFQSNTPKLRLMSEGEPGVAHALYAGFDSATSDLIARIDADTFVGDGWAAAISSFFDSEHEQYVAGTGLATMHDMPFQKPFLRLQKQILKNVKSKLDKGQVTNTGGIVSFNGVVTKEAWKAVRSTVSYRRDVHENTDMSLCVLENGGKIAVIPGMTVRISGRRYLSNPWSYFKYASCEPNAFKIHGLHRKTAGIWAAVFAASIFHLFIWIPARSYDPNNGEFSIRRIFTPPNNRVLPVSISGTDLSK